MNTKTLTELSGYADILSAAAEKGLDELVLTGAAVEQFAKLVGYLHTPLFDAEGKPILNAKKKPMYVDVPPNQIESIHFTRNGPHSLGYAAGFSIDYVRKLPPAE